MLYFKKYICFYNEVFCKYLQFFNLQYFAFLYFYNACLIAKCQKYFLKICLELIVNSIIRCSGLCIFGCTFSYSACVNLQCYFHISPAFRILLYLLLLTFYNKNKLQKAQKTKFLTFASK